MCAYAEEKKQPNVEDIEGILPDLMIGDPIDGGNTEIDKAISKLNQSSPENSTQLIERLVVAIESLNKNLAKIANGK